VNRRACLMIALAWGWALPYAAEATTRHTISMQPGARASIRITPMFEVIPRHGVIPVRVHISNQSGAERTWHFSSESRQMHDMAGLYTWKTSLTVPDQGDREVDWMIPVFAQNRDYFSGSLIIHASGYGTRADSRVYLSSSPNYQSREFPFVGMDSLLSLNKGPIDVSLSTVTHTSTHSTTHHNSRQMAASSMRHTMLPTEPVGFSGLDALWLTDTEWRAIDPASQRAITGWMLLGGRLLIATQDQAPLRLPGLPELAEPDSSSPHGFGLLERQTLYDSGLLTVDHAVKSLRATPVVSSELRSHYQYTRWNLRDRIPNILYPMFLILLFVVVFGALLGPVNLFIAHRRKKPSLMLWTTPLLSLLASVMLAGVIVFSDGFGGQGERFTAIFLQPAEQRMAVVQEQVSRTALLFDRAFELPAGAVIYPVDADTMFYNRSRSYERSGRVHAGSWFSSRAIQGHVLKHVEPTRERLEILRDENGALVAQSSIRADLETVFYLDRDANWWTAPGLSTGERKPLEPASREAYEAWFKSGSFRSLASESMQRALKNVEARPGYFYALARNGSEAVIETLPAINWHDEAVIWCGPVVTEPGSAP